VRLRSSSLHVSFTLGTSPADTLDLIWELRFQLLEVWAADIMGIIYFGGCIALMGSDHGTLIVSWADAFS